MEEQLNLENLAVYAASRELGLILHVLMKAQIRENKRLKEYAYREPIDVRIQHLHLKCKGFKKPINFSNKICKDLQKLMNQRNNILHGSVVVEESEEKEIFFDGNVPLYTSYQDPLDRPIRVLNKSVGFCQYKVEYDIVNNFIEYVLSFLDKDSLWFMKHIMNNIHIGYRPKDSISGVLLPEFLGLLHSEGFIKA